MLATGLVISGLGLLVTGMFLGQMPTAPPPIVPTVAELAAPSLAAITAVSDDGKSLQRTGVVIDDDGHVLVSSEQLTAAVEFWGRVGSGELERAELVAKDDELGIAVLRVVGAVPRGAAPSVGSARTSDGVEVVHQVRSKVLATPASVATPAATPIALTVMTIRRPETPQLLLRLAPGSDLAPGPVFDSSGRFVALATRSSGDEASDIVAALPAGIAMSAASQLVAAHAGRN